jgi:hypothetical protein
MSDSVERDEADAAVARAKARYDASVKALEFELEQFWKRSLFFWGFIGAAFVAFSTEAHRPLTQSAIASFGFVCSTIWTLANRGSKYWYENWQEKREETEKAVTGALYGNSKAQVEDETWLKRWLQGRRYSPSRLAIALSDYAVVLWLGLLASRVLLLHPSWHLPFPLGDGPTWITVFTFMSFLYAVSLWWICHVRDKKAPPPS